MIIEKLGLLILSSFMFMPAFAYDFEVDGIFYTILSEYEMTCEVSAGGCEYEGIIEIPAVVSYDNRELSVTALGDYAFADCNSLVSVTTPNSLKSIGSGTFGNCIALTNVSIGNSVTVIGNQAFMGCLSLESVTIPDSVTEIGDGTFSACTSLKAVTIPDSVTKIGSYAFEYCGSLEWISIPASVESLGKCLFENCPSLVQISVAQDNPYYCSVDGVLFSKDCSTLLSYPCSKDGNIYFIPSSVTTIAESAFWGCGALTSVTIPDSVTNIESDAFNNCVSLTSIKIPDSVTKIGESVFWGCYNLTSVTISNKLSKIETNVFRFCTSLKSVIIPESVLEIGSHAFLCCNSLISISIPSSVIEIGNQAFAECLRLTSVFYNCENPIQMNGGGIFDESLGSATLYVPVTAVEKCKMISPWKDFMNIEAYDFSRVESVTTDAAKTIIGHFDTTGAIVNEDYKGVVITKYSDGSTKKNLHK